MLELFHNSIETNTHNSKHLNITNIFKYTKRHTIFQLHKNRNQNRGREKSTWQNESNVDTKNEWLYLYTIIEWLINNDLDFWFSIVKTLCFILIKNYF